MILAKYEVKRFLLVNHFKKPFFFIIIIIINNVCCGLDVGKKIFLRMPSALCKK